MKISVLTPTYNDSSSIRETLQSLLEQSYSNWEWIIINDGSTDCTDEVVKQLVEEFHIESKCIYLKQDNADQLNAILNGCEYITGDYVFVLHSDDLLPNETFFEQCVDEMQKNPSIEGLFGDLIIIDEESKITGLQKVKEYVKNKRIPALMLLWLGRNLFADVAFHKTTIFKASIKEYYLTWNMPFWLSYEKGPQMVNYKKVDFPILKYRVHGGNYVNNELGKHNVLNGELRTAIKLMHHYDIPNFKLQYTFYRLFNKFRMENRFKVNCKFKQTHKKAEMIDFIIKKRFPYYDDKIYFKSIYQFYKNQKRRIVDMSKFSEEAPIYCGKDTRAYNKCLLAGTLDASYIWFMEEMKAGFDQVVNYEHLGKEKVMKILRFFCIEEEVKL